MRKAGYNVSPDRPTRRSPDTQPPLTPRTSHRTPPPHHGTQGKLTEAFWSRVALTRYQSSKATLAYADFLAYPPPPATADGGGRGGKRVEIR